MSEFSIQVQTAFSASHTILLPDDTWEPVHGHNWPVEVEVKTNQLDGIETVLDFHILQQWLSQIIKPFKNRHLNDVAPFVDGISPTAERVSEAIGLQLVERLKQHNAQESQLAGQIVELAYVKVGEAMGCWAIWRPVT